MTEPDPRAETEKIEENIRQLEKMKADGLMPPELADASIGALKTKRTTYQAQVQGGGASAQGADATAIEQHGVGVKGSVSSSLINTGAIFQIYQSASGKPRLDEAGFERILRNYLEWLRRAYGKARLYGLESIQTSGSQKKRELSEVFEPLFLQRFSPPTRAEVEKYAENFKGDLYAEQRAYYLLVEQKRDSGEAVPTKSMLMYGNRIAVIGSAGSGKSTLLAYLAAMFAEHELTGISLYFQLPEERKTIVPLIIPLRYRREYLRLCKEVPVEVLTGVRPGTMAGFVLWYLKKRSQAISVMDEKLAEEFFDRLLLGGGCLVMLDGLDEVVGQLDRGQVRAEVERLAEEIYPDNIYIVSARESGYKENAIFSEDFFRFDIKSLENEQIENLVHNWCMQLYPDQLEKQKKEILRSINSINKRYEDLSLPALVRTPLMTTMVVSVKWGEAELPRERARLYEAVVKVILQAQYLDDDDQTKELVNWGGAWEEQREWLSYLALEMHRGGQNGVAIPEERLREILISRMSKETLDQFIRTVRSRGGLFEERADLFQFAHLTFQEFLAARLLTKDREKSFPILEENISEVWWREVFLLVYGFSKQDYAPFSIEYLKWLSNLDANPTLHLAGLELAGAAVLEIEKTSGEIIDSQTNWLLQAWQDASENLTVPAVLRVRAGKTLSLLGDPRFSSDLWHLPKNKTLGFLSIPAGKFLMGSVEHDRQMPNNEKPVHELDMPNYWMAKYPVTVAQYCVFIEDSKYTTTDGDALKGYSNHPVTWVTWYDALAYTKWLNEKLQKISKEKEQEGEVDLFWQGLAAGSLYATLPSEAEWEKASRGVVGSIYPWGNNFDLEKSNTRETKIGAPSSVGCFPSFGYELSEMSGNVWEWTRDIYHKYPFDNKNDEGELQSQRPRMLRGGSFYFPSDLARCSYRFRYLPEDKSGSIGFRIVITSISRDIT